MDLLRSLVLAFSSFSKIPMPRVEWREGNMRYMMCFFPLVGVVIGLALALWTWAAGAFGFGQVLFGAGIALIPIAVTGGIHLDGFCDVVDAQSSHAPAERKRQILSDPHIGAFAAIGVACYIVAYVAVASEIEPTWHAAVALGGMHVASRCMSGIATVTFPTSKSEGMLSMFHESAHGKVVLLVLVIELVASSVAIAVACPAAVAAPVAGGICLVGMRFFANSQFGGMSGDLAGFFLQSAELVMLVILAVVLKVVAS